MNTIVKLSSTSKLSQVPSHNVKLKLDNKVSLSKCLSYGKCDKNELSKKVPYKTVINHFAKIFEMLKSHPESHDSNTWPPKDSFVRVLGGDGFGMASHQEHLEEILIIPPMIQHINPNLQLTGFQLYLCDLMFL
jgi:hypothetical protein